MANPIISRAELAVSSTPMTVQGVIKKTTFLLGLTTITGIAFFLYSLMAGVSSGFISMMALGSIITAFIMGWVIIAKPHLGKVLAIPYAILEGVVIGAISLFVTVKYPTIAPTAMVATFVTAAVMLALYQSRVIRVTEKFRSVLISAVIAITLVYLVQIGLSLFSSSIPYLFSGGVVAIGFSLFVVIIASLSLLLDFDNVERAKAAGVDESYEWVLSIGILSTLVWMYIEFVRLLRNLQN
jgi:uncharacterized YccA/Bax inhibitor family protein